MSLGLLWARISNVKRLTDLAYALAQAASSGSGGLAPTMKVLTNASAQYTTLASDALIEVDLTGGALAAPILLEAAPTLFTRHRFKNTFGDASVLPILINGNGKAVEDPSMPGGVQTYTVGTGTVGTSVALKVRGQCIEWMWDGARWIITATN